MNDRKEILFFKQCDGMTTPEEDAIIRNMLACSEDSRTAMETIREVTSLEKKIEEMSSHDTEEGYAKMVKKARQYESRYRISRFILKACAVICLPLAISVSVLGYMNFRLKDQLDYTCWQETKAMPGTVTSVELPDHSRVWINSGSTLSYPTRFRNGERVVKIDGEAFFKVTADREHPFCVVTESGLEILAHGTEFNVAAYRNEKEVEATLVKGAVSLLIGGDEKCQLEPGESGVFSKEKDLLMIRKVNTEEKTAWTEGKIMFRNAPMEEVFQRLGRRYNVDFIFHDPYGLSDRYRCRITFQDETIQQVLGYLEIAAPIRYTGLDRVRQSGDVLERQRIEVWLENR